MQLTPTEAAIYRVLADGEPHSLDELRAILDSFNGDKAIHRHLPSLRKKLTGLTISATRFGGQTRYQLTRKMAAED